MTLNDPKILNDLVARLGRLSSRLVAFAGINSPIGPVELAEISEVYALWLSGSHGLEEGERAASRVLHELVDRSEWDQPRFWSDPLGRACAWWVGFPEAAAPRGVAAAVLDCSRQNIHDHIANGRLNPAGPKHVTANSLRGMLRRRYPLEA